MNQKNVASTSVISLMKQNNVSSYYSLLIFILTALLIIPVVTIFFFSESNAYKRYNTEEVIRQGEEKTAIITEIQDLKSGKNETRSGAGLISYNYQQNGLTVSDKFQATEVERFSEVKVGDEITIKVYKGQSAIEGPEPYGYRFYIDTFVFPVIISLFSLFLTLNGLIPALRLVNLYKNGMMKEAVITSMIHINGKSLVTYGNKIFVDYQFTGHEGKIIHGHSQVSNIYLRGKEIGDNINIFVSKNDENNSCLVPEF
jgi:hypothetical protein